ncbi:putative beta- -glucanase [Rosellinia necatrix]|uniref:glucan endo-1,6-beta-glucosidase n=1 Tax=Rosellinia necatrix TaxID=77044 RepID=A0A1W2TKR5_ROSNE|nr:putative beta- -glucanase [Rosellinia necatrix]
MRYSPLAPLFLAGAAHAWLPQDRDLEAFNMTARFEKLGKRFQPSLPSGVSKIRGVNFGSWLISEPFFMSNEWPNVMGCGTSASEFDCMRDHYSGSNRDAGNAAFEKHWATWITPATVQSVHDVGLNTIRIPIGYWSYTAIVDKASEPFADGDRMLPYLDAVVSKAADLGIYVIIDLHGAPGGQQQDVFTGQNPKPAGFFNDYNYGRAEKWLAWMANRIHTNPKYRTVGMLEVLNEPVSMHDAGGRYPAPGQVPGLTDTYYPAALAAVRQAEAQLGVGDGAKLHVQFMSAKWSAGNPRSAGAVQADAHTAFDDHNYIGFGVANNGDRTALMQSACRDSRVVSGEAYDLTGEWSMTSGVDWSDADFFRRFWTAQQQLYEKPGMAGWVYWTWKTELNDPRWTYSYATSLGYVPTDAAALEKNVYWDVCAGYT